MTREVEPRQLAGTLRDRIGERRLVLFFDYDGTLTSIVDHPEQAVLDDDMRRVLALAATSHPVFVISGRDLADVRDRVGVEGVTYVGSHGFHVMDAFPEIDRQALEEAASELKSAANELEQWLDYIEGVVIERKKFSFALHYRMVDRDDLKQINSAASDILERYASVTWKKGKKVIEFVPDIPWDKGCCVLALLSRLEEGAREAEVYPVYIGDDVTDEDAFRVIERGSGLSVLVAEEERDSAAEFRLRDPGAVRDFLDEVA